LTETAAATIDGRVTCEPSAMTEEEEAACGPTGIASGRAEDREVDASVRLAEFNR
jgi:hypothetical protein